MKQQSNNSTLSTWFIFRWPIVINSICLVGLISALIGNGWLDIMSWVFLSTSITLMLFAYIKLKAPELKNSESSEI